MMRNERKRGGSHVARAARRCTVFNVTQPAGLMEFLMQQMAGISRTRVKALLVNRVVSVDNRIQTKYDYLLEPGMQVQISKEKHNHEFRHPMLKILYEDAYLIVVEKKEGLLSVATDKQKERTAQHILNEYVKRQHRNNRVFVVHRLDRETSGIMMYAKDEKTQHSLRDGWHDIVEDRRYVAVVMGEMEKDSGTVESWLTDRTLYVSSSPVDDGGKHSITHYRTIKRANGYSLVELQLETGRKNQIRVHMQVLGHPVVGDERYGCEVNPLGRMALHAFKLCFRHPITGERMEFETLYPGSFKNLMLRK